MKSISEKTFQIIIRSEIITIIMKIFLKTACVDIPSVDKSASVDNWDENLGNIRKNWLQACFSAIIIVDKSGEKCE